MSRVIIDAEDKKLRMIGYVVQLPRSKQMVAC